MQYHIQTAPVWDAYKQDGCPICRLFKAREDRLVNQYLTDNVMDPDFRVKTNENGFCPEHIKMLYDGQNKLGLALQLETRAAYINSLIKSAPTDKKQAKKLCAQIEDHTGCVICETIEEIMPRYFMTIAQMYDNETEFPALFGEAKHCLKHAAKLFDAAAYAGKSVQNYLAALTDAIKRELSETENELRVFADCFDFRNAGAKPDPDTIPRAIKLLIK